MKIVSNLFKGKLKSNVKWFSHMIICFFIITYELLLPLKVGAISLLSVENDKVIQDNFLGVNAVYHGFSFMEEEELKGMNANYRKIGCGFICCKIK